MIDKNKQYRTRDGRDVRIYATDGDAPYCIHGAVLNGDGWNAEEWLSDGKWDCAGKGSIHDLIEVKPRIQREVWVNVYPKCTKLFSEKRFADEYPMDHRIACVRLTIDCEEGEGL